MMPDSAPTESSASDYELPERSDFSARAPVNKDAHIRQLELVNDNQRYRIRHLEKENGILRTVVKQMRTGAPKVIQMEMELDA